MSGLVGYGSSDEDDDGPVNTSVAQAQAQAKSSDPISQPRPTNALASEQAPAQHQSKPKAQQRSGASHDDRSDGPSRGPPTESTPVGPSLGPSRPSPPPSHVRSAEGEPSDTTPRPPSPHSAYREAMQSLTLPTVPDFSIPASPPGSPPAGADARVAHFLDLKRAKGLHFNERLAGSSALKNPSLLAKLVASAGLPAEAQYASSLPPELWDPAAFPRWAYKEELERARVKADRAREAGRAGRRGVDFVKGPPEA